MEACTGAVHKIQRYLYFGLAFLLWENAIGAFLGIYHIEIRRTLWGIFSYGILFLLYGSLTEAINALYNRLFPKSGWSGQRHLWLMTILILVMWGDLSRQAAIALLDLQSVRLSYLANLVWIPLVLAAGLVGNLLLAHRERSLSRSSTGWISPILIAMGLYLILSTKITYRYFPLTTFSALNIGLQPFLGLAALAITLALTRVARTAISRQLLFITFPIVAILIAALFSCQLHPSASAAGSSLASPQRLNIVLLVFDALRADHVGLQDGERTLTPTLDSLALRGQSYSCYATSSWTFSSIVGLLTSKMANKLGLESVGVLPDDLPTLASYLSERGYYTAALSANDLITPANGFARSFQTFEFLHGRGPYQLLLPFRSFFPNSKVVDELAYQFGFVSTDLLAADWQSMNQRAQDLLQRRPTQPFFLYMHYIEPHAPYWAAPFRDGLLDLQQLNWTFMRFCESLCASKSLARLWKRHMPFWAEAHHLRYKNGVRVVDQAAAQFLTILERLGLADNTIIIVTADHGEEFLEHGRMGHKCDLFNELIRVPLIIAPPCPSEIELPDVSWGVSHLDLLPTVLNLAGVSEIPPDAEGHSLLEPRPDEPHEKYAHLLSGDTTWTSMVAEPYKLILQNFRKTGRQDTFLFNIETDPKEKINLYPAETILARRLASSLQEQMEQGSQRPQIQRHQLSPSGTERLRALGYLN